MPACRLAVALAAIALSAAAGQAAILGDALTGEWVSDCVPLGRSGRHGLIVRLELSPHKLKVFGQMYARNICDLK